MKFASLISAAFLCAAAPLAAHAQMPAFPKNMTIVVPFPPGGSNDTFARVLADELSRKIDSTVIVENRPGAGGAIGATYVSTAPADGSVLMLSSSTFTTNAAVQPALKYDVVKSFEPIAMLAASPMAVVVGKESGYQNLRQLLDKGREKPGQLTYGSAGVGSINQMASEILAAGDKSSYTHVPYKGMAPAMNDLSGGRVDFIIASFASLSSMLKADRVRILAVTSPQRSPYYQDVATVTEIQPGYSVELWWGVLGPKGMPAPMVEKLNAEIRDIVSQPKMKEMFAQESAVPANLTAPAFAELVRSDAAKWKTVAQERNISVE